MKRILTTSIATALFTAAAQAAPLYWDINGTGAGAAEGTDVSGIWNDTNSFWTTNENGTATTVPWIQDSDVYFSAGTNGGGATSIVRVDGVFSVNSFTFQEGPIQLGTDQAPLPAASALTIGAGGITLASTLLGNATFSTGIKDGILLSASQSWINNTVTNSGAGTVVRTLQMNANVFAASENISLTIGGTGNTAIGSTGGSHGSISDSGSGVISILKQGTGTLTLNSANSYRGLTTISAGTVLLNHANGLGSAAAGTVVSSGAALSLSNAVVTNPNESLTISGAGINSFGALTTNGGGAGGTWAGDMILGSTDARVGAPAGTILTISGAIKGSQTATDNQTLTFSGFTNSSAGEVGTLIIATPAGASTYTGGTNIVRGILKLGADNALPTTTIVDMHVAGGTDPSTFDLNGFNQTISGLRRTINGTPSTVTNSALGEVKTLTLNQSTDQSFGGTDASAVITGNLALEKAGTGKFTLSAANSYTGGTHLVGGTLEGTVNGAFGTGNVTVASTATTLTIQTGVLNAIANSAILSLAGGGIFGEADQGYLTLASGVTETVHSLVLGGVTMPAGIYGSSSAVGVPQANQLNEYFSGGGTLVVTVPEPTSGLLMFAGLGSLLGASRLRRARR